MTISNALSAGLQGIQAGIQRANIAGGHIAAHAGDAGDADALAMGSVEQLSGRRQVELSAQVVKATDQMLGTLIDIRA